MNQPAGPADPMTELAAEAALHHEIYLAYLAAGFTEPQAFALIKALVTAIAGRHQ